MHRIIAGGTGLIGKRLAEHWLAQNHTVSIIGRSKERIEKVFGKKVKAITWDKLSKDDLRTTFTLINLAGENIASKRWTKHRKQQILTSRTETTAKLAQLLVELGPDAPHLFNASAIGIYGLQTQEPNHLPPRLDEESPIPCDHPPDFLSLVACRWEEAAKRAIDAGVRVTFLRFGVVLAAEGGALPQLVRPFRYYLGGPIGTGDQPFSWVAIEDVIRAIDFLIDHPELTGPFNIVAPGCVRESELAAIIAGILNCPDKLRLPSTVVKLLFGEMGRELLLEGQHVYPTRLLTSEFSFHYPTLQSILFKILLPKMPNH